MKKVRRKPAVFLDRDGTLIHDAGFLNRPSQVKLFPGTAPALKMLRKAGFYLLVVSNQSGVARGYFPESSVKIANRKIQSLLRTRGAWVDRFFYCPHYPGGQVKSLAVVCSCRKPKPGMVRQAARLFPIDLKRSYVVGDKMDDLLLTRKSRLAGGILVKTGKGKKSQKELAKRPVPKSVVVTDILAAARHILKRMDQ